MSLTALLSEILSQALDTVEDQSIGDAQSFSTTAETLADELYRLCIEFGFSWNDFRQSALPRVLIASDSDQPFADVTEDPSRLALLILAFELMPEETTL